MTVLANTNELVKYLNNALDTVSFAEQRYQQKIVPLHNKLAKLTKKESLLVKFLYVYGIVCYVIMIRYLINAIRHYIENGMAVSGLLSCIPLLVVIVIPIFIIIAVRANKKRKVKALETAIAKEAQWINNFYAKNIDSIQQIPCAYHTSAAIKIMRDYIVEGRANDLQSAMNLCDAQLHRWRMEAMQNEIVIENRNQSESLRSIRRSSSTTAAASVANVFIKLCK